MIAATDLLMKLVKASLHTGTVDVLAVLLEEARKWDLVIELRQPITSAANNASVVLHPKQA